MTCRQDSTCHLKDADHGLGIDELPGIYLSPERISTMKSESMIRQGSACREDDLLIDQV